MKNLREVRNRYEFELDNRQLVVVFAGLVIVLILSFSMGTLFGKSMYSMRNTEPVRVADAAMVPHTQVELAMAEDADQDRIEEQVIPQVEPATSREIKPAPVTNEELERENFKKELAGQKPPTDLKQAKVEKPAAAAKTRGEKTPVPLTKPTEKAPAASDKQVAKADADKSSWWDLPEQQAKPKAAAAKPKAGAAPASGIFTIQVASSQSADDAQVLAGKLRESNFDAYVVAVDLSERGIWHRVRVGGFASRDHADNVLERLKTQLPKYEGAYVTNR